MCKTIRVISVRKALSHKIDAMDNLSSTNWARIDAMKDEEIDTSDIPPLSEDFFAKAQLRMPDSFALDPGNHLDPWTQSLIGVIQLDDGDREVTESYVDYLEEKYG